VFNQAIYAESVENHLICLMQCRVHGVTINNTLKMFVAEATEHSHAIIIHLGSDSALVIPLALTGLASTFAVRTPSLAKYNDENNTHIVMTSESLQWDPHDPDWESQEAAMTDLRGHVFDQGGNVTRGRMLINSVSCSYQSVDFTDDNNFAGALKRSVNVCCVKAKIPQGRWLIDKTTLAEKWMVLPEIARQTLSWTTRHGIRTRTDSTMACCFSNNDRQMHYKHLPHDLFTDTMHAKMRSCRGDLYAQVYCSSFRWSRAFPMKKKSEAADTFDLLFHRDGVPTKMIMNGSKVQTLGRFCKKCIEASVHCEQTEPYSSWQNQAEGGIQELKKASGRKMVQAGAPKAMWADAIEYEAYI